MARARNSCNCGSRIIDQIISSAAMIGVFAFPTLSISAQTAAAPPASQPTCSPHTDTGIPINTTIQARVSNAFDAAHLKPGKEVWVNSATPFSYPGCNLDSNAAIYAHVTSASASKNPTASELSLQFDRADCTGHNKQALKLILIGVVASSNDSRSLHDAVPTELHGGSRQISDVAADTSAYDAKLSAGGPAHTVKPGTVIGIKNVALDPLGGPSCSSKLTSTSKNIELPSGTMLILAAQAAQ